MPSRKPRPRTSRTSSEPASAASSSLAQLRPALRHPLDQLVPAQVVDHREPDRALQRGAAPRVAQLEGARPARHGSEDGVAAEHRPDRHVAGPESLRDRDHVGLQRQLVGREPCSRAAHPGHDLVEADEEAMFAAALVETAPEGVGRRVRGQRRGAHRLAEEGRDGLGPGLLQHLVERRQRGLAARVEAPGRGRDVQVLRGVAVERPLQARPPGQRQRRDRRAVVGLRGRDDPPALRLAALDVIAARQPQRRLVGLRAAGDEVDAREAGRRQLAEGRRELLLRRAGELLAVEIGDLARLVRRRLHDLGDRVTEARDHRAAGDRVEVLVAAGVPEPDALGLDDQRVGAVELAREDAGLVCGDLHRNSKGLEASP